MRINNNSLADSPIGAKKTITKVLGKDSAFKRRIMEMGFVPGTDVTVIRLAPLGDPIMVNILGYDVAIRKSDAKNILIDKG